MALAIPCCNYFENVLSLYQRIEGTRACLEALSQAGGGDGQQQIRSIAMAGGATRSVMWLQMHADVTQLPVHVGECENAPLLGGAVLAAAAVRHRDAQLSVERKTENEELREPYKGGESGHETESDQCASSLSVCIEQCVHSMVRKRTVIQPNKEVKEDFDNVYRQYVMLAPALADIFATVAKE